MRASSLKMLVSVAALGVLGAALAFVCARGLSFSDPDPVRPVPAALHEPAWPAPQTLPQASLDRRPVGEAVRPQPQTGAIDRPIPEQVPPGTDGATQLLNGFLGQPGPDGGRALTLPQMTPDQAAAAARNATDLINGMLANHGQGRNGSPPPQIDPSQAAAAAESAAKMLNGMFQTRGLGPSQPKDAAGDSAPADVDQPVDRRSEAAPSLRGDRKYGNDIRVDPRAVKDALRALGK
jgi:hypothetical protein